VAKEPADGRSSASVRHLGVAMPNSYIDLWSGAV
jgi:hypothetical protein